MGKKLRQRYSTSAHQQAMAMRVLLREGLQAVQASVSGAAFDFDGR